MQYKLTTPCTAEELAKLRAGDTVLLSGVVYTARDQAHKRMLEALDKGEPLPFPLEGSAIYYVGPTPERPGEVIGSAGPTTSGRMDAMSPRLLDLGNKVMIGKGKRDAAVKEAVRRNGAVYLAALGGAGALMAKSVKTLEVIAWPDLGCEAHILSAHRTPAEAAAFAKSAKDNGFGVILCAAGMAAHLAGAFAANTTLPVIGIPMKGGAMDGMDALLATVQMPSGIPVATVALNGAKNAAWLAAEILALSDDELAAKLTDERAAMAWQIAAKEQKLQKEIEEL